MQKQKITCPLCQGSTRSKWRRARVWRCQDCDLLFKHPTPTRMELEALYHKSWSAPDHNPFETGTTDLSLAQQYTARLLETLGWLDFKAKRLLEFGAGTGRVMEVLVANSAEVIGVEPYGYEEIRKKGLTAYRNLDELGNGTRFDGIVTFEVIEHLSEPWKELARLRDLLSDGGWILLSTPNAAGLNATLSGSHWREVRKTGHITFFSPSGMESLLRRAGFVRFSQLNWNVRHNDHPLKAGINRLLQKLRVDGALRYIAWR